MAAEKNDKIEALLKKIEDGTRAVFESENYKNYLNTVAKFHRYSFRNQILIYLQNPDATMVAGYNAWQTKFHRQVRKGEKAIQIIGYAPKTINVEVQKRDELGIPMVDEQGNPIMVKKKEEIRAFKAMYVFDVSQTEGEPLPTLGVNELTGNVQRFDMIRDALINMSPVPVGFEEISGGAKGFFSRMENRIAIQKDMSELQTVKTLIHEVAHAFMHGNEQAKNLDSHVKETEAESVAYVVCQHLGLDTSEYSFPYLAGWSTGKELPELQGSLERISKQATAIVAKLEETLDTPPLKAKEMEYDTSDLKKQKEAEPKVEQLPLNVTHDSKNQENEISNADTFSIYQLSDDCTNLYFMNADWLQKNGLTVDQGNYNLIYTAPLHGESLEDIYYRFNINHPADFKGHSLSVSDVVVLRQNGQDTAYFCDSVGFKEVPKFLQREPEQQEQKKAPRSFASRMSDAAIKASDRNAGHAAPEQTRQAKIAGR